MVFKKNQSGVCTFLVCNRIQNISIQNKAFWDSTLKGKYESQEINTSACVNAPTRILKLIVVY